MTSAPTELERRLDRIESLESIRQLSSRYALAVDVRDLDAIAILYVDDIRVGTRRGRGALRDVFAQVLRQFRTTSHQVQNQLIEFDDADRAQGLVTCRCEHELQHGGRWHWVVVQNVYHDRYERRAGHWFFKARVQNRVYSMVDGQPPLGGLKDAWPGRDPIEATFHRPFASWREFWDEAPSHEPPAPWTPQDNFIHRLRRSEKLPALAAHIAQAHADTGAPKR